MYPLDKVFGCGRFLGVGGQKKRTDVGHIFQDDPAPAQDERRDVLTSTDPTIDDSGSPLQADEPGGAIHRGGGKVLQTDDLFLGALGLARGGQLVRAFVRGTNGRRVAVFEIAGPGMDDVEREYYSGRSLVDLRLIKSEVVRLKNTAFAALRGEEERRDASESNGNRRDQAAERFGRGRQRAWD